MSTLYSMALDDSLFLLAASSSSSIIIMQAQAQLPLHDDDIMSLTICYHIYDRC
jgi:hypothetical protein